LFESMESSGTISLGALFGKEKFEPFIASIDLVQLIDATIRGGWPQTLGLPMSKAGSVAAEYINAIVRNVIFRDDQSKRDQAKVRKLLRSLARNNATTASVKTLSLDTEGTEMGIKNDKEVLISRDSVAGYLKSLKEIFVIEEIPPWNPQIRSKAIMRQAPKRVYSDPSLAAAALGANRERLLRDLKTFGLLFKNLCLRDLSVYADVYGGHVFHYRDNSDLEVDAIVEMPSGSWGAFEIKLGEGQVDGAANTLLRMGAKMAAAGAEPPACLAVITGGGIAMPRNDGIYVLPVNAIRY